ncbi:MAG TPA: condensation domain-containing protein, partial [Thermoanaerobaculia bacterium]|nr:condensation domain-containing protein [Thermoanaerobaculia bacterium]
SGSTGRPKGIAIEHRSAAALMCWAREAFRDEELAGVLASTSICFDMSVFELFAPLSWGGTVILADNALALAELPARAEVTLIDTVPSAMAELLRQGAVPRSVKTVNLGGEPLRGALARQVHWLGWVERLLNLYGPSEDTTFTSMAEVGAEGEPTIGCILPNSWGYVVDRQLRLVPVGVPGELYLAGAGLSRGYLGRPELTAERYVPDPFSAVGGERLYQTGDLVRWRRDGELEYLGRLDLQVKIRGFRVELGEIESALVAHPCVEDAAVLAQGEGGERRLVAYVVGQGLDLAGLRGYLKEKLPEYMVPSFVVELEALPLTPNGKIDRRALARIEPERAVQAERYQAPRTAMESRLAAIWTELLGIEKVGIHDDFFDLGGHSLLATQLVSRMRESFGVELPLRLIFEISTVEGLGRELAGKVAPLAVPPLRPVPREGDLPLSFAQERLWFLEKLEPGSPIYNLPVAARLIGALDVAALTAALGEIVRRHEALRTVFSEAASRPVQRMVAWIPFPLPVVDLSERRADLDEQLREETAKPFDLASGALVRGRLLRLGEAEHVVVLTFHHIAADGWSIEVLLRELSALYQASSLPELPIQYADFAVWQREWLRGEVLETQLAYWRGALAGLPPALDLPTDRPRPALRGTRGGHLPVSLDGSLAAGVRSLAQAAGATPFMVLLAGLQTLLSRLSGQVDLAVGSAVANRNRIETEPLIGFFANMLVLRGALGGDPSLLELLERTRAAALGAYAHQDVPFEKLVEELAPERDPSRTPLFQVSLVLQNAAMPPLDLPGLKTEPLPAHGGGSRFDLTLLLRDVEEGFAGLVEYASGLFDAATVERLLGHYRTLLAGALAEPARPLFELPLLTPEERAQLLAMCGQERAEWPADALLHDFFEAQARRTPAATALIVGAERLTYRDLDARANAMARRLVALGVGPEVRVGIFLRRTSHLVISLLATLKAGGAYVPLDPAYPRERLEAILGDAEAPVVVTEEALVDA